MCLQWETAGSQNNLYDGPTRDSVDHFDPEANVVLISSDGVRFQVWDYELRAGR